MSDESESNMGSLFDDIITTSSTDLSISNTISNRDVKDVKDERELVIEAISIIDVLKNNKERFNTNNIWTDSKKPDDYVTVGSQSNTCGWIDKFHKNYSVINIPVSSWMKNAWGFGTMTGTLSKLHTEDIDSYIEMYETPAIKKLLESKKNFVRSDLVSLKRGVHGVGPYTDLRQIVESLVTTDSGHSVLTDDTFKSGTVKLYLMDWIENMVDHQEFRVFVHNKKITAISQQGLYSVNSGLDKLDAEQRVDVIKSWVKIIQEYFEKVIVHKLDYISSYSIDFSILQDGSPYFIEINPFGREYSSGSSLFGWVQDDEILYGKTEKLYFRYTCREDDECVISV